MSCYLYIYAHNWVTEITCSEFEITERDADDVTAAEIYGACIKRNPGLAGEGRWFEVEVEEEYDLLFKQTADAIVDVYRHCDCVFLPEDE